MAAGEVTPMDLHLTYESALQQTVDALAAANPHPGQMDLPPALTDDGGYGQ